MDDEASEDRYTSTEGVGPKFDELRLDSSISDQIQNAQPAQEHPATATRRHDGPGAAAAIQAAPIVPKLS